MPIPPIRVADKKMGENPFKNAKQSFKNPNV